MALFSAACWLNREWDDCVTDRDCPEGQICWRNDETRVCILPEYVDLGDADVSGDVDSDAADLGADIPDDATGDSAVDLAGDVGLDLPPDEGEDAYEDSFSPDLVDIEPDGLRPAVLTLRNAGITTSSGTSPSTTRYRLIRHGFEQHDRVCSAHFCVTGGVSP